MDKNESLPRWIDEFYGSFCDSVCEPLRSLAHALPYALRLAPSPDIPFSQVFHNEVTLGAPLLVSEAIPEIEPYRVREATRAHFFAILEAFGTDRLQDGQVRSTGELQALLEAIRAARDRALLRVVSGAPLAVDYVTAQRQTHAAMQAEHAIWDQGIGVSLSCYEAVSAGKQAVGLPATLALAQAAHLSPRRTLLIRRMLLAIWLGLQEHDDVADWQDDAKLHGAWAVSLARDKWNLPSPPRTPSVSAIHESGVLHVLLRRSRWQFRAAGRRSTLLGALKLAGWCRRKERELDNLATLEHRHPGYVARARALSPLRHEEGFS